MLSYRTHIPNKKETFKFILLLQVSYMSVKLDNYYISRVGQSFAERHNGGELVKERISNQGCPDIFL